MDDLVIQTGSRTFLLGINVGHRTHNLRNINILGLNCLSREATDVETGVVFHLLGRASQITLFRKHLGRHLAFLALLIS